jgi:hypothetical protein
MTWEGLTDINGSSAFFDSRLRPVRSNATYARNALVQTQQEAVQTQQNDDPEYVNRGVPGMSLIRYVATC